uniref:Protein CHLOROPLAST IMPORT APPARATUS 2-like n=1 Tax=Rhizophora mucronata TaxID=61149 RepID=A0A2P2JS08_RHIMU
MSSSCLSGGGRTYRLELEIVKSPSTSTRTSHTSSPSSTLSESSNSPLALSTRKPRTPRKRPNQTYDEAAALLSTVYPNIFSNKHLTKPSKFTKPRDSLLLDEPPELFLPFRVFDNSGFPLHQPVPQRPNFSNEPKVANFSGFSDRSCQTSSGEVDSQSNSMELCDEYGDNFDAESILDEEIEEGIDSIMGNLSVGNEMVDGGTGFSSIVATPGYGVGQMNPTWYGNPIGRTSGVRAFRKANEATWWNFPIVDMLQISPRLSFKTPNSTSKLSSANSEAKLKSNSKPKSSSGEKKKKKIVEKPSVELKISDSAKEKENPVPAPTSGLLLKLNYEQVLNAWSDRGLPFSDDVLGSVGNDVSVCLSSLPGQF